MKYWNEMTDHEKKMLTTYGKYLVKENLTDQEKEESFRLTKFCVIENDLCVTQIPKEPHETN